MQVFSVRRALARITVTADLATLTWQQNTRMRFWQFDRADRAVNAMLHASIALCFSQFSTHIAVITGHLHSLALARLSSLASSSVSRCSKINSRIAACFSRESAELIAAALNSASNLERQRDELAEALRPFSTLLQPQHSDIPDDRTFYRVNDSLILIGDLRRAVSILAKIEGERK